MKVLVMRASNTENYGALMMAANFISVLRSKNQTVSTFVDTKDQYGLDRVSQACGFEVGAMDDLGLKLRPECKGNSFLMKLLKYFIHAASFGYFVRKSGVSKVVQLGGDDLSEYYPFVGVFIEFIKIVSMRFFGIKIFLVGQTIGPFSSWRKIIARFVLSLTEIYSRDEHSFNYVRDNLGLKKAHLAADLAFLDLPGQGSPEVCESVNKYVSDNIGYTLIVPSGLWRSYSDDWDTYIQCWAGYIQKLIAAGEKVVLLAHVISDTSSDNRVISAILARIESNSGNLVAVQESIQPVVARELIRRASVVVAGRMHACVSAAQVGTPFVAISYSVKFKGVLGELSQAVVVVESEEENLFKSFEGFDILLSSATKHALLLPRDELKSSVRSKSDLVKSQILCVANEGV